MEKAELTALIVRAQAGDQEAMEEILRTAHTSVSYQCRKLLRDPRDAEDMTQEVLLTVYTRLDSLKTPEAFWGWLNQTTANRCVNALKRSHVELQFAEDEEGHSVLDNLEELDEQQVPDKALDNTETTRMIEEIVDGLPEAQRLCTLMYYYDEMSVKDIAAALDVPENTVKSRLNYARKAVKERVLDYEKKGVKLYGLSPLPFMLYFLLHAAEETADSAAAGVMAQKAMELGAAAAAGGEAVTGGTAGAGAAAGGKAAVAGATVGGKAVGTALSAKFIAGVLATVLTVGGVTAAVAITRNQAEPEPTPPPAVTETLPPETERPPEETAAPEPTGTPPVEEEPIPAERLALLSGIAYYGDPAQCRMTANQARAFAEVIERRTAEETQSSEYPAESYAALVDIGEGKPILVLAAGPAESFQLMIASYHFLDELEVWQYVDGQAERFITGEAVYYAEGKGLMTWAYEGDPVTGSDAYSDWSYYPRTVYRAYSTEDGVLSAVPVSTLVEEHDGSGICYELDGQPITDTEFQAWCDSWWGGVAFSGSSCAPYGSGPEDEAANMEYIGIDYFLRFGPNAANLLRQCAGE